MAQINMVAVEQSIIIGLKIQKDIPEIGTAYLAHERVTLDQLVRDYAIESTYHVKHKVAQMAVWRAIHGYAGELACINSKPYKGLIPAKKLSLAVKRKRHAHGVASPTSCFKAMTKQRHHAGVRKSHINRGSHVYSYKELLFIFRLAQRPDYYKGKRFLCMKAVAIANQVNKVIYTGKQVRSYIDISGLFERINSGKKKLSQSLEKEFKKVSELRESLKLNLNQSTN